MKIAPEIVEINGKRFKKEYSYEDLKNVINNLADRINNDYQGKTITLLIVLKGAMPFAVDLMKRIDCNVIVETISAKSYGESMESSRSVTIFPTTLDIHGKDVIIIEDIADTGHTLKALRAKLLEQNPNSLEIAALFSKPAQREVEIDVKYIGIEIPPIFIVGYGLDFAEQGRQYAAVYQLMPEADDSK